MILLESRKITNSKIVYLVKNCIEDLHDFGVMPFDYGNDIELEEMDSVDVFGKMCYPKFENGPFVLKLSKHLFTESDKAIKSVILHELAHYIQEKKQFEHKIIKFNNGKLI